MTAGSLFVILSYVWLIITAIIAVIWYRRRTKRRAETQQNRLRLLNERDAKRRTTADDNDAGQTASAASATNTSDISMPDTSQAAPESEMVTAGVAAGATAVAAADAAEPGSPIDLNEFIFDGADNPNGHESLAEESGLDFTDGIDTDELDLKEDDTDEIDLPQSNGDSDEAIDHSSVDDSNDPGMKDTDPSDPAGDVDESDHNDGDKHPSDARTDMSESDDTPTDDDDANNRDDDDLVTEAVDEDPGTDRLLLGALPGDSEQASPDLGDLLGELDMPYGLEPLPGSNDSEQEHGGHVALVSYHGDAAEIGTALADALVDRGYEFEPIGHDRGLARRSSDLIALRIIPEIGTSDVHTHYSQLGLADSAMVIEMWSGQAALDATSSNAG